MSELVTCTRCQATYPHTIEHFGPIKHCQNGLASTCRACRRAYYRRLRGGHNSPAIPLAQGLRLLNMSRQGYAVRWRQWLTRYGALMLDEIAALRKQQP